MQKITKYSNGLTLIVDEMPSYQTVSFNIFVKTGSVNETSANLGISHLIEHMMFKGTKTRSSKDITYALDSIGAIVNAYTDKCETVYYTKCTDDYTEKCVEILSDMLLNSVFNEEELAKEKNVVVEEISMYNDDAFSLSELLVNRIFYNKTKFEEDVAGTKESVLAITRNQILNYIKKYYTPSNIVISFAGNVTEKDAKFLVEKYLVNNMNNTHFVKSFNHKLPIIKTHQIVKYKDNEQAHVCISYPGTFDNDKIKYAMSLFNIVWGVGLSSKLVQKIREKLGLVYLINSSTYFNEAGGDLTIHFATNTKNVPLALKSIKEEINLALKNGITEEELIGAKNSFIAQMKMQSEATEKVSLSNVKKYVTWNQIFTQNYMIKLINSITVKEVNEIIKRIYKTKHFCLSYVGEDKEIDLLQFFK